MIEQVAPDETGRLDIMFQHDGRMWWIDVAITHAASTCTTTCRARAHTDGKAARDEEQHKRTRYHNRATPFVLESLGRPGQSAVTFIRRFATDATDGASCSTDSAWRELSSVLQAGNAQAELSAYGPGAIEAGLATLFMP